MFCKEDKCDKCGLQIEYTVQKDSDIKQVKHCVFKAIFESMCRQEQADVRIQSSIESARNEQVKQSQIIDKTVANGFLGLIKTISDNKMIESTPDAEYCIEN